MLIHALHASDVLSKVYCANVIFSHSFLIFLKFGKQVVNLKKYFLSYMMICNIEVRYYNLLLLNNNNYYCNHINLTVPKANTMQAILSVYDNSSRRNSLIFAEIVVAANSSLGTVICFKGATRAFPMTRKQCALSSTLISLRYEHCPYPSRLASEKWCNSYALT